MNEMFVFIIFVGIDRCSKLFGHLFGRNLFFLLHGHDRMAKHATMCFANLLFCYSYGILQRIQRFEVVTHSVINRYVLFVRPAA